MTNSIVRCGVALTLGLLGSTAIDASVDGDVKRLADATTVLSEIHAAPDRDIPDDLWQKAECIAVIPGVKKAAFVLGGEYGKGVISCRAGNGWSAPGFLVIEKGSVGFQIGAESVELVLLVMNRKGIDKLFDNKIALGAEASVAGGPVGRDTKAMTDGQLKAQILSYSRAQGLFAGIDLTGGALKPDNDENCEYYGKNVTARSLLLQREAPASAQPFLNALERHAPSVQSR